MEMYYGKMADELIRYNRINRFIFQPRQFLSFSELKYNLRPDEIVLLQSLLTQEYFTNLVYEDKSDYVKTNTYDTACREKSGQWAMIK